MEAQKNQSPEIDQQQIEIADSGSDVKEPVDEKSQSGDVEEYPNGIDDEAGYMDDQSQQSMPANSTSNSSEEMKLLHLFDLSQNLIDYANIFEANFDSIDYSRIEKENIEYLEKLKDRFALFKERLQNFIIDVFYKETYEKNLYIYLSLRQELLIMVKYLRQLLKLETLVVDTDEKSK